MTEGTIPSERVPLPIDPLAWQEIRSGFFFSIILANLLTARVSAVSSWILPIWHITGSHIGHELDQGPTRRIVTSKPSIGHNDRPNCAQSTKNMIADIQYALNKCESSSSGKQLILHGNPSAIARNFLRKWQVFDVIYCQICILSAVLFFRGSSKAMFTSLLPVAWKTKPIGVEVCPHLICADSGCDLRRQPQLIAHENEICQYLYI